jgi:CMP/dCMP kinase
MDLPPVGCLLVTHAQTSPRPGIVIALDGPSGSGKSSTSRGVATRLGFRYLDTGAMFRAITWAMLRDGVDVHDTDAVAAHASIPVITSGTDPQDSTIHVDGTDVGVQIRGDDVVAAVSPVASVPAVRTRLLELQREIIGAGDIVVEGRDIGSVVAPDAEVKLYLTADAAARAARRALEEGGTDVAATEASLLARDTIDSTRKTAPLTMPDGATHIDTTDFTLEQVIGQVLELVEAVRARA